MRRESWRLEVPRGPRVTTGAHYPGPDRWTRRGEDDKGKILGGNLARALKI